MTSQQRHGTRTFSPRATAACQGQTTTPSRTPGRAACPKELPASAGLSEPRRGRNDGDIRQSRGRGCRN